MLQRDPTAVFLPRPILEAWTERGLRFLPSSGQVAQLAPLVREPTGQVAAAVIAAMPDAPPVGRTYRLVGVMLAAARTALSLMRRKRTPVHNSHIVETADDAEASVTGTAHSRAGPDSDTPPVGQPGHPPAWERIRTDPGSWYNRAQADLRQGTPRSADTASHGKRRGGSVAGERLPVRDVSPARKRPLP